MWTTLSFVKSRRKLLTLLAQDGMLGQMRIRKKSVMIDPRFTKEIREIRKMLRNPAVDTEGAVVEHSLREVHQRMKEQKDGAER